jgi:tetratricopeptide (TPR) repeat protein
VIWYHGEVDLRRECGREYLWLISQLVSVHEMQASLAAGRKILVLWEDLYRAGTKDEVTRESLDSAHRFIAVLLMRLGNFAESLEHYRRSLELQPPAGGETAAAWRSAADLEERVAVLRGRLGDRVTMEQGLRKAIELDRHGCVLAEAAWKNSPKSMEALRDFYNCETAIMRSLLRLGDERQALDFGRKAITHVGALIASGDQSYQLDEDTVRPDAVLLAWQLASEHADYTGILDPPAATPERIRYYLAHGFCHLGHSLATDGLWQASLDAHRKSAEMFDALLRENPRNKDHRFSLALAERSIGDAYLLNAKRADRQREDLDHARAHLERARFIALELEAERLLPNGYAGLPRQLTGDIAACDALAKSSAASLRDQM